MIDKQSEDLWTKSIKSYTKWATSTATRSNAKPCQGYVDEAIEFMLASGVPEDAVNSQSAHAGQIVVGAIPRRKEPRGNRVQKRHDCAFDLQSTEAPVMSRKQEVKECHTLVKFGVPRGEYSPGKGASTTFELITAKVGESACGRDNHDGLFLLRMARRVRRPGYAGTTKRHRAPPRGCACRSCRAYMRR